jgi:hypothetical protein
MYAKADRAADHSEFLGSRELTDPCSANPFEMIHGLLPLTKTNIDRLEKQSPPKRAFGGSNGKYFVFSEP